MPRIVSQPSAWGAPAPPVTARMSWLTNGAPSCARVDAGDDGHGGRLRSADLREAEALAEVAECERDEAGSQLGEIGRRCGAAVRVARDADDAVLAQVHGEAPEAAGVRRHDGAEPVEDADHRRRPRRRLGEVEPARLAVEVVAQVDLDGAPRPGRRSR